jgi:hypothetical protein
MFASAIILLICLSAITFLTSGSHRQVDMFPQGMQTPPGYEYYEQIRREQRNRWVATLIFAIILLIGFSMLSYGV